MKLFRAIKNWLMYVLFRVDEYKTLDIDNAYLWQLKRARRQHIKSWKKYSSHANGYYITEIEKKIREKETDRSIQIWFRKYLAKRS